MHSAHKCIVLNILCVTSYLRSSWVFAKISEEDKIPVEKNWWGVEDNAEEIFFAKWWSAEVS